MRVRCPADSHHFRFRSESVSFYDFFRREHYHAGAFGKHKAAPVGAEGTRRLAVLGAGAVTGLQIHTLGGVVSPGQRLMDVIPKDEGLILEVRVPSHLIDRVHADGSRIIVKSGEKEVMIRREELGELIGERYPTTSHHRLNLPGLLFLQSGPSLQAASAILLRREHRLQIPDGRRTMRYIFHMSVAAIDADKEKIVIFFDMERLPKRADGSSVLA